MQTSKNGRTILVGEDEMEVRGYFEMALKCLGYPVELAQDGDEVLSCLQSSTSGIGAVLLDIMMPNRDGIDTLREIRRIDPNLPVIIISGDSSTLNVVTAMKSGERDFLRAAGDGEDDAGAPDRQSHALFFCGDERLGRGGEGGARGLERGAEAVGGQRA